MSARASSPTVRATLRERYGVSRMLASHPAMRQLRREGNVPSIHGNKHWPSADLLMDYLSEHPPRRGVRVMDVGCGWGLAGIYCAVHHRARVTAVDADDAVFPYLHAHADLNKVRITTLRSRFERITTAQLSEIDLLVATDVCFWDELVRPWQNLIRRALRAGVKRIVIADPERAPFFTLAEYCIERFDADLLDWRSKRYPRISGSILEIRA